jgi:hypothetical protein
MGTLKRDEIWVSLLEVEALGRKDGFEPGERAFVNAATLGDSTVTAEERIMKQLADLGFHVVRFEGTETIEAKETIRGVSTHLRRLANRARRTKSVALGTFHSWEGQG